MNDVLRRLRDALRPPRSKAIMLARRQRPPATRLKTASATMPKPAPCSSIGPWPSSSPATSHDERLQIAYLGQGVIGTNASPLRSRAPPPSASTTPVGRLGGMPGMWGYVRGGMGMVSFYFCDAAREAGATVVSGVPVARILPGEGVELEAGDRIPARTSSPTPTRAKPSASSAQQPTPPGARRSSASPSRAAPSSSTSHLRELPNFTARPGCWTSHTTTAKSTHR